MYEGENLGDSEIFRNCNAVRVCEVLKGLGFKEKTREPISVEEEVGKC